MEPDLFTYSSVLDALAAEARPGKHRLRSIVSGRFRASGSETPISLN